MKIKKSFSFIKYLVFLLLTILFVSVGYKFYLKKSYPIKYEEFVNSSSNLYGVEQSIIYAVIKSESSFNPTAQSHANAIGLMQILPSTYAWLKSDSSSEDSIKQKLLDPETNIDCGVHLISLLINRYQNFDTAICAYNAGMGNVDKWLKDSETSVDGKTLSKIPYPETDTYLKRVNESKTMYTKLYFN